LRGGHRVASEGISEGPKRMILTGEIGELAEAKKEIYLEAKGNGYDVKTLREVIRIRKQDPKQRDEQESLLDVYMQAIKKASRTAKAA
jgi:uncharacterized protein (UPF0335 family)